MNVYSTDWFLSSTDMQSFYTALASDQNCISQWNHPLSYSDEFSGFAYYSPGLDSAINLVEVMNGKRDMKYVSSYIRALDKGWHVGPSAGSDTHNPNWITGYDMRTAILAQSLSQNNLFSAIRKHRIYATEDSNLSINFSINGAVMGSILTDSTDYNVEIDISDPDSLDPGDKIRMIEIIGSNGIIVSSKFCNSHRVVWNEVLERSETGCAYYFLKVTNDDGKIAVTAPVWLEYKAEKNPVINYAKEKNLTVYDILGKRIKVTSGYSKVLSRKSYPAGIYIISETYKDGSSQNSYLKVLQ